MVEHTGLPVKGYKSQPQEKVDLVNANKALEEKLLRQLDSMKAMSAGFVDQRWLAIGRNNLEVAFMAINRAVFQPERVILPEDVTDQGKPAVENPTLADVRDARVMYSDGGRLIFTVDYGQDPPFVMMEGDRVFTNEAKKHWNEVSRISGRAVLFPEVVENGK